MSRLILCHSYLCFSVTLALTTDLEVPYFYKPLSLKLYQILEDIGATTDNRELMIQRCKCNEILGTALSFQDGMTAKFLVYCVGSIYEGTQTHGMNSDVNQVAVLDLPVVNECSDTHDK